MFRVIILSGFLIGGSYAAGFRVHPENIPLYFKQQPHHEYYELELNNGNKLAGEIVRETPQLIEVTIGSGTVTFPKSDILKSRILSNEELDDDHYQSLIIRDHDERPPLWTRRYEDSILPVVSKAAGDLMSQLSTRMMDEMSKKDMFQNSKIQEQLSHHKEELQELAKKFGSMQNGQTAAMPSNIETLMNNPQLMREIQKAGQDVSAESSTAALAENYFKKT